MGHPEPPPASGFRLRARAVEAGLLRLPWHRPLAEWEGPELVDLERGIGRHVVRFVELGNGLYALKELAPQLAEREYRLLVHLSGTNVPAVEPVGIVAERRDADGRPLDSVLVTRYLEFSLPFRLVLARRSVSEPEGVLLDGLAELLVRLHLAGVFWGDCSLSNTLFRRDAGALAAHLVDAETAEVHERLTDGQREHDLEVSSENLSYELYDLACELGWQPANEPTSLADEVLRRYERLWAELVSDEVFALDDASRLEERLRRLNELGFDAEELEVVRGEGEYRLRLFSQALEAGHHRRRLLRLTGLDAQEKQARRLLADIDAFRAGLGRAGAAPVSEAAAAAGWVSEVFEPSIAAVPAELRSRRAAAELFHELLEHRWYLSERAGAEASMEETVASYVEGVLRPAADERTVLLRRRPERSPASGGKPTW